MNISLIIAISALIFVVGLFFGDRIGGNSYKQEAIDRGFAEYSKTTGEWGWVSGNIILKGSK